MIISLKKIFLDISFLYLKLSTNIIISRYVLLFLEFIARLININSDMLLYTSSSLSIISINTVITSYLSELNNRDIDSIISS